MRDELEAGLANKTGLQNRLQLLLNQKQVLHHKLLQARQKANNLALETEKEQQNNTDLQNQRNHYLTELNESDQDLRDLENSLVNKLTKIVQLIAKLNQVQTERGNYLAELNELDNDYRSQEQLLADKNAKLAQALTQKDALQTQLTNQQNLNQALQDQVNNHTCSTLPSHTCSPCALVHLPEPHICPIINQVECSHSDYPIITQLNQELDLGLDNPDSQQIIIKLKELIYKPPTIKEIAYENQEKLNQAQQTITKLEQQLNQNQGSLKTIRETDEKLIENLMEVKIPIQENIEEVAKDYQQFAEKRQGLLFAEIKNTEVQKLTQLIPKVQKEEIKTIQQVTNYQQLATARQTLLAKYLVQNQASTANLQTIQQEKKQLVKQRNLGLAVAGTILTAGLASTIYLGRKVKELKRVNQSYYSDYQKIKDELSVLLIKMHGLVEEKRG